MKRVAVCICTIALTFLLYAPVIYAAVILADTTGPDNLGTTDFYGVNFLAGTGFIHSVVFDISIDPDAFFDFDGALSYNNSVNPIIGESVGLTSADISWVFSDFPDSNTQHPSVLTFNFTPGSFGVGDYFRFSADTDFFVSDPAPGTVFATGGASFSALLEDNSSGTDIFRPNDSINSTAFVETSQRPVPEPTTMLLFGAGLVGLAGFGRKKCKK